MKKFFILCFLAVILLACGARTNSKTDISTQPQDEVIVEVVPDSVPVDTLSADSLYVVSLE